MIPTSKPSIVALIPARAGSKRVPGKAIKPLGGKPLIRWTVEAAESSGIFQDVLVCSDDVRIDTASGARAYFKRPLIADAQPDVEWILEFLGLQGWPGYDAFAILRPTSPFRTADTIRRAWQQFQDQQPCDSIRAVQPVREHPGKMWQILADGTMTPIMPYRDGQTPWHSKPTQTLPKCYVQNASLEIAWTKTVRELGTISGERIMPFFTEGDEGFDINTPEDWADAERLMAERHQPLEYLG